MATTVIRNDNGADKGLKITRTYKRWDMDNLVDVNVSEDIYIHQSDIQKKRDEIARKQAILDAETASLDQLEAKLTQLWIGAS